MLEAIDGKPKILTSVERIASQKFFGEISLVGASPDLHFLVCVWMSIFIFARNPTTKQRKLGDLHATSLDGYSKF